MTSNNNPLGWAAGAAIPGERLQRSMAGGCRVWEQGRQVLEAGMTEIRPAVVKYRDNTDPARFEVTDPGDYDGMEILRSDRLYSLRQLKDEAKETRQVYRRITGQRMRSEVIKFDEGGG